MLYVYNNFYALKLIVNVNYFRYDIQCRVFEIKLVQMWPLNKLLENKLKRFFYSLESYYIKKLKFAGKSFRIEKKEQFKRIKKKWRAVSVFNMKFGKSYPTWISIKNTKVKQLKKTRLFFIANNLHYLMSSLRVIIRIRKWNLYTQRGLRLYKQKIWKKPGKKSAYM